jgi:hypothetical protein
VMEKDNKWRLWMGLLSLEHHDCFDLIETEDSATSKTSRCPFRWISVDLSERASGA